MDRRDLIVNGIFLFVIFMILVIWSYVDINNPSNDVIRLTPSQIEGVLVKHGVEDVESIINDFKEKSKGRR